MKKQELNATLGLLNRVLANPRVGRVHQEKLRKAIRELSKVRRSGPGKLRRDRVFRATLLISEVLLDLAQRNDD